MTTFTSLLFVFVFVLVATGLPRVLGCEDDPLYTFGTNINEGEEISLNCAWITKNKKKVDQRRAAWCDETVNDQVVKETCRVACLACVPTVSPTLSNSPTISHAPTISPTVSDSPTSSPTRPPSPYPSPFPTARPSPTPSDIPSKIPSSSPTRPPSPQPSPFPTARPSVTQTDHPSSSPTPLPTTHPSSSPTTLPSPQPSLFPSSHPSILCPKPSCTGDVTTFKFYISEINRKQACAWAIRLSSKKKTRCSFDEVAKNCCASCCTECAGDATTRKFFIEEIGKKQNCAWAGLRNKVERCSYPEVRLRCCYTCRRFL